MATYQLQGLARMQFPVMQIVGALTPRGLPPCDVWPALELLLVAWLSVGLTEDSEAVASPWPHAGLGTLMADMAWVLVDGS